MHDLFPSFVGASGNRINCTNNDKFIDVNVLQNHDNNTQSISSQQQLFIHDKKSCIKQCCKKDGCNDVTFTDGKCYHRFCDGDCFKKLEEKKKVPNKTCKY